MNWLKYQDAIKLFIKKIFIQNIERQQNMNYYEQFLLKISESFIKNRVISIKY